MENVTIEQVKKIGSLHYFVVRCDSVVDAVEFFHYYPNDEEEAKSKAIKYAKELRAAEALEVKTLIEF